MMRPLHRIVLAIILAVTGMQPAESRPNAPDRELVKAVTSFNEAIVSKNRAALDDFIASEFFWITGSGKLSDKAGFIDALTSEHLEIRPYAPTEAQWIIGDRTALLAAMNRLEGTSEGKAFVDAHRYSNLWRLRDNRWELLFIQITPLPARE